MRRIKYDGTSASLPDNWGPVPLRETSNSLRYLLCHPEQMQICSEMATEMKRLKALYLPLLGLKPEEQSKLSSRASLIYWDANSVADYQFAFLVQVLCGSYQVFNETHGRYPRLLRLVRLFNPEWVKAVESDHELKLRACRVPVYPL